MSFGCSRACGIFPWLGIKPVVPTLADGFLSTYHQGSPFFLVIWWFFFVLCSCSFFVFLCVHILCFCLVATLFLSMLTHHYIYLLLTGSHIGSSLFWKISYIVFLPPHFKILMSSFILFVFIVVTMTYRKTFIFLISVLVYLSDLLSNCVFSLL